MKREFHVRFCERLWGRFPLPTRPISKARDVKLLKESKLNIEANQELFDKKQEEFILELAKTIKSTLEEKGVSEDLIYDTTDTLVFNIGALLDGSATAGELNDPSVAYLAFRKSESEEELLISPIGSYIHEIAMPLVENVFE